MGSASTSIIDALFRGAALLLPAAILILVLIWIQLVEHKEQRLSGPILDTTNTGAIERQNSPGP